MPIRYPAPLSDGGRIGVTAPSSGVPTALHPRLEFCLSHLRTLGYEVVVGSCIDGSGIVSAPPRARADELMSMLLDPDVHVVLPPWGGELAVEVLPDLDLAALAAAEPTWLVGFSDISTLQLPLTTVAGIATLHGANLLDTPYRLPSPLRSWLEVVTADRGARIEQGPAPEHRAHGEDRWEDDPSVTQRTFDTAGTWRLLDPGIGQLQVAGRLLGGCIETVSILAGTPYGDVPAFAVEHAPDGLVLFLEASGDGAPDIARHLWRMRLAGWFEHANALLIGRTKAPAVDGFSQLDALRSVLAGLDLPVVVDLDCGHVPPQLSLVNGAIAELTVVPERSTLLQHLH